MKLQEQLEKRENNIADIKEFGGYEEKYQLELRSHCKHLSEIAKLPNWVLKLFKINI